MEKQGACRPRCIEGRALLKPPAFNLQLGKGATVKKTSCAFLYVARPPTFVRG